MMQIQRGTFRTVNTFFGNFFGKEVSKSTKLPLQKKDRRTPELM